MIYFLVAIAFAYIGFKLGTKYQSLLDIMQARRIKNLIETAQTLANEKRDFERAEQADKNYNRGEHVDY
jgi:hypothetical protein